ncbi:hypothetical protein ARAF_1585 [Arsenophonus endosymbiont of Aleurodicus floccissimus]|nr:hypothetical protein ARAF_1585 [Arsenophonus endosymbiont of Aleurodicus floccissimus]
MTQRQSIENVYQELATLINAKPAYIALMENATRA